MSELKYQEYQNNDCSKFSDVLLKNLPLTMAYVPIQPFDNLFTEEEALTNGTLFSDLNKPFYGKFTGRFYNEK